MSGARQQAGVVGSQLSQVTQHMVLTHAVAAAGAAHSMPWVFTYNDWSAGTEYDWMVQAAVTSAIEVRPARCAAGARMFAVG